MSYSRHVRFAAILSLVLCAVSFYFLGSIHKVRDSLHDAKFDHFHQDQPPPFARPPPPNEGYDRKMMVPSHEMSQRYESPELWRADNLFEPFEDLGQPRRSERPVQQDTSHYDSMAKYLEQTLVADYPKGVEDIFLMLKTGGTVMWERLPIHLFTTLTRVKNFALYSDMAGSIGGYEVVDILKDLPEEVLLHEQLTSYRLMRKVHQGAYNWAADDIDFHDRKDGWSNDKFKNIPMLADAYARSPDSKWFVFMDDDTYIFWDSLVQFLQTKDHTERMYFGSPASFGRHHEHHGEILSVFGHGGSGVAISKAAMDYTFGPQASQPMKQTVDHWSKSAMSHCCGDVVTAFALFEMANVTLDWSAAFQGEPITSMSFTTDNMCKPLLSFHHLRGHEIEVLWEYERLQPPGKKILYYDVYRDFVLPWVVEEREDWWMQHVSRTIRADENMPWQDKDGKELIPYSSKEQCRKACESSDECLVWSFWEGTCQLKEGAVVRGVKATRDYRSYLGLFGEAPKVWCGWMVDRIRQRRANTPCDPLTYNKLTGNYNDNPSISEGWAHREMEDAFVSSD